MQPIAFTGKLQVMYVLAVRLIIGCVLITSGLGKIRQPYDFLGAVYQFEMVGPAAGLGVAIILPWLEFVVGICLIAGVWLNAALLCGTVLSAVFIFAQYSALRRGLEIDCGCFGAAAAIPSVIGTATFLRVVLMLLVTLLAFVITLRGIRQRTIQATVSKTAQGEPAIDPPVGQ